MKKNFNASDLNKNAYMLTGRFKRHGYDWWWHSFTAIEDETGEEIPFFIEFFLINPANKDKPVILGQSKEAKEKGLKPSYLMIKCGRWGKDKKQLHKFVSWQDFTVHEKAPFFIETKDDFCSEVILRGNVTVSEETKGKYPEMMSDAGNMQFSLKMKKQVAWNVGYGTSKLFRDLKAFEMYWHAEGMKTLYEGEITLDGRHYTVTPGRSFGYADKNWGSNFTSPWVWLSSCCIFSYTRNKQLENTVFDIGGGKPKVFGIQLPRRLLGALWLEGEAYEFNFSKFWTKAGCEFSEDEDTPEIIWHVQMYNKTHILEIEASCKKEDMLFVNYEDPDGKKRFNHLWNGGNGIAHLKLYKKVKRQEPELIEEMVASHLGCEYGEFDK